MWTTPIYRCLLYRFSNKIILKLPTYWKRIANRRFTMRGHNITVSSEILRIREFMRVPASNLFKDIDDHS